MFYELLARHMRANNMGAQRITNFINTNFKSVVRIRRSTIDGWASTKNVQQWRQIVAVAAALQLSFNDADELVRLARPKANNEGLEQLFLQEAQPEDRVLFKSWELAGQIHLPVQSLPHVRAFPTVSQLPFASDPSFVGRELELLKIARDFNKGGGGTALCITGSAGIGKTQLAIEFAHRYGCFFKGGVYWFNAKNKKELRPQIAASGGKDGLDLFDNFELGSTLEQRLELVLKNGWGAPDARLIIFDNCEDETIVNTYLPYMAGSRLLITSRHSQWQHAQTITISDLTFIECQNLLHQYYAGFTQADIQTIIDYIGRVPLGLLLIAKHIAGTAITRADVEQHIKQLSQPHVKRKVLHQDYISHLRDTILTVFRQIKQEGIINQIAYCILGVAIRFAPGTPIAWPALIKASKLSGNNKFDVRDAFARLANCGLSRPVYTLKNTSTERLLIHHYVCEILLSELYEVDFDNAAQQFALNWITKNLDENIIQVPTDWNIHMRHIVDTAISANSSYSANLAVEFAHYLKLQGDFSGAKDLFDTGHQLCLANQGTQDVETIGSLIHLGETSVTLNQYQKGQQHLQKALHLLENSEHQENELLPLCLNRLATAHQRQHHNVQAQTYFERGLDTCLKMFGMMDKRTGVAFNDFGLFLTDYQQHEQAETYLQQALKIRIRLLGEIHQDTAETYNNLGYLYYYKDMHENARIHLERALAIRRTIFGEKHPSTANACANMGFVLLYSDQKLDMALRLFQQAIEIESSVYGRNTISIAIELKGLGSVYKAKSQDDEAITTYNQALEIVNNLDHPDPRAKRTIGDLHFNLGEIYSGKKSTDKTIAHYKKAYTVYLETFGPQDKKTILAQKMLATFDKASILSG